MRNWLNPKRAKDWLGQIRRPAITALVCWGLYLLGLSLLTTVDLAIGSWPLIQIVASALVLIAFGLWGLPLVGWLRRWGSVVRWRSIDWVVSIALLIGIGVWGILEFSSTPTPVASAWFIVPTAMLGLITFWRLVSVVLDGSQALEVERPLFDEVLTKQGLAPIQTPAEDELERKPLVDQLYGLVTFPRAATLNFGLEGGWGAGKTSLLNLLRVRLEEAGITVVTLNLWSYRDPARLVEVYFDRLATALSKHAPGIGAQRNLRKLGSGLVELSGSRVAGATRKVLGDLGDKSVETVRDQVADVMRSLDQPIVMLIDDLDRLERDELLAVIRSVHLARGLPNLSQVLAYDREQLSRTLFPDDPDGTRARDHLAKVIHHELSIGSPPREVAWEAICKSLEPLLERADDERQVKDFNERLSDNRKTLVEVLYSPREMRRVAGATAVHWQAMSGHLNLFDLFVLTIVQYRAPMIYVKVRASPEWFNELNWSSDLMLRFARKDSEPQEGEGILKDLEKSKNLEKIIHAELLRILFPNLVGASSTGINPERQARSLRRINHPALIERYFHLYIPSQVVTEKEVEDYAAALEGARSGAERQGLLETFIKKEAGRGRLSSFFDQWELVFGKPPIRSEDELGLAEKFLYPENLIKDLALGFAKSSHLLNSEEGFFQPSQVRVAASRVLLLCSHLSEEGVTSVLVEVIETAQGLDFAGNLVALSRYEKLPDEYHEGVVADKVALRDAFTRKCLTLFAEDPRQILELPRSERAALLFQTSRDGRIESLVLKALEEDPSALPVILIHATPRRSDGVVPTEEFSLGSLAEVLDVERLNSLTEEVPLGEWTDPVDRQLVERFRMDWKASNFEDKEDQV